MKKRYRIAENVLEIITEAESNAWRRVERCYDPFQIDTCDDTEHPSVSVKIFEGIAPIPSDAHLAYEDKPESQDMPTLYVYRNYAGHLYFKIIQPRDDKERLILKLSADFSQAEISIEKLADGPVPWQTTVSLTGALQLAYHFATLHRGNVMSHASCVVKDGKAYLFLGKSGTGKSTHSRMWKEAFPDAILLNDDHPILRINSEQGLISYGSPWSGKTPCYKNISAPVGAIVRITRAPKNSIRRLSTVEAYASLMSSIFNAPFDAALTDLRHAWLEKAVGSAPCYELHCLPDADAARVCWEGVKS